MHGISPGAECRREAFKESYNSVIRRNETAVRGCLRGENHRIRRERSAPGRGTAVSAVEPAGILRADSAGGTPAGPTGRMPVPRLQLRFHCGK